MSSSPGRAPDPLAPTVHPAGASSPRRHPARRVLLGVALLTLLSAAVRLHGIGYLLPHTIIGDGSVPVTQVRLLRDGGDPARGTGDALYYPYLLARLVALIPEEAPEGGAAKSLDGHLRIASAPWRDVRLVSALLSILAVPGTWLLARRFVGDGWALLAAAYFSTSLMHADFSAQDRPHGMVTTFVLFAVLAALRLRRRADVGSYLLAGATAALAIGSLQSGLAVLPAFLAAVLLQERVPGRATRAWSLASLAIVALGVLWSYPFHFVPDGDNVALGTERGESVLNLTGHLIFVEAFDGSGFRRVLTSMWFWDPILAFACIAGAAFLVQRLARRSRPIDAGRRKDLLVVAAYALPFLLVNGAYAYMLERFLLPLFPLYATLAAYGTRRALATCPWLPARFQPVLAACVPAIAALPVLQLARLHGSVDTYELVARWLRANVAAEERVVTVPHVELPVFQDELALEANANTAGFCHWVRYQIRLRPEDFAGTRFRLLLMPPSRREAYQALARDPVAYFAEQGARYVVFRLHGAENTVFDRAREVLREHGDRMLRVTPLRRDSSDAAILVAIHDDEGPAIESRFRYPYGLRLFDYERMGPVIEVYRLAAGN